MTHNKEELSFRPVARMTKVLGEHLIRDNTTGILELIKNGYDADADHVLIELNHLSDPEMTEVIIEDNGSGMDKDVIRGPWSEPAHGGKQMKKDNLGQTPKGRTPLGEKGVGRFATQKLGKRLEMITKTEGSASELYVKIDWDAFDKSDAYLDEIGFPLVERAPEIFIGDRHGTRLVITSANEPWKRSNVERLRADLVRLMSPSKNVQSFQVNLKCPDYPELQNLEKGTILENYQFKIDCNIDESGKASYTFYNKKPNTDDVDTTSETVNLWSQVNSNWEKADPQCGPFRVVITAWLRTVGNLKNYGFSASQLDILCGMSIYRDGFRIVPYGDMGDDWLRLDPRRTNQPGQKYGNNQIIGQVEITQIKNPHLIDKTSREGLQENQSFFDMRDLVLGVVSLLEFASMKERKSAKNQTTTTKKLQSELNRLKEEMQRMKQQPKAEITTVNNELDTEKQIENIPNTVQVSVDSINSIETKIDNISKLSDKNTQELTESKEENQMAFLHLVGIGLVAERFCHEFDRLVASFDANLKALESKHPFYSRVKALRHGLDVLKNEVSLIGAARYVKKSPESEMNDIKEILNMSLMIHKQLIDDKNIHVEFSNSSSFSTKISTASLFQVLDNIIANACHWLSMKTDAHDRKIHIAIDPENKRIVISNNGPHMPPHVRKSLFKHPFVTSKHDGRGLGMYISNEILSKNNGHIDCLPDDHPLNKYKLAAFSVYFD